MTRETPPTCPTCYPSRRGSPSFARRRRRRYLQLPRPRQVMCRTSSRRDLAVYPLFRSRSYVLSPVPVAFTVGCLSMDGPYVDRPTLLEYVSMWYRKNCHLAARVNPAKRRVLRSRMVPVVVEAKHFVPYGHWPDVSLPASCDRALFAGQHYLGGQ